MSIETLDSSLSKRAELAERLLRIAAQMRAETTVAGILDVLFESFQPLVPFERVEYAALEGPELVTRWVRTTYQPVLLDVGFAFVPTRPPPPGPWIDIDTASLAEARPANHPSRILLQEGVRSGLCCPLDVKGQRLGYLFFCSRRPRAYDELHVWVMSQLAGIAAGAIAVTQLYEDLQRYSAQLEDMARHRAAFLSAISHELRTPLTGVLGLARILADSALESSERDELLALLLDQAEDAVFIVDDLLVVGMDHAGHLEVSAEPVDLAEAARSVLAEVEETAEVEGSAVALADPVRVRQILRNLLTNAAKYGGSRIWVTVGSQAGKATAMVCDDGPGVDPQVVDAVFRPYERGGRADRQGHGLGLWVSRLLSAKMGGSLTYARSDGVTRFVLSLPPGP